MRSCGCTTRRSRPVTEELHTVTLMPEEIALINTALSCYTTFLHHAGIHNDNLAGAKEIIESLDKAIALFERLAAKL